MLVYRLYIVNIVLGQVRCLEKPQPHLTMRIPARWLAPFLIYELRYWAFVLQMAIYKIAILVVGGAFSRQAAQFEHLAYVAYTK